MELKTAIVWQSQGRSHWVSEDGRFDVFLSADKTRPDVVAIDWDYGVTRRFATEEEAKGWCVEQLGRKPQAVLAGGGRGMSDDAPEEVDCRHCGGAGERGCSGGYLEMCGTCNGTGKVEPCVVCGKASIGLYPGSSPEDAPSCGRVACGMIIQQGMDYHDERGG